MTIFAQALLPIFLLILLGYLLNSAHFPSQPFWPLAARVTYFVLLPALLIKTMATAKLGDVPILAIAAIFTLVISGLSIALLLLRPHFGVDGPTFTSIVQGGIRQNSYVGLAATAGLLGEAQLVLAAVALAIQIPVVNLWSVIVLARFGKLDHPTEATPKARNPLTHTITAVARNPLIIACAIGIALNPLLVQLNAAALPQSINVVINSLIEMLSILGRAALPFGLLTVGAGLRIVIDQAAWRSVFSASITKLLLYPIAAAALCWLFRMDGAAYIAVILFAALPTSTSSYILAREMGGNHELMAAILTLETLLALATMPLMLSVLG